MLEGIKVNDYFNNNTTLHKMPVSPEHVCSVHVHVHCVHVFVSINCELRPKLTWINILELLEIIPEILAINKKFIFSGSCCCFSVNQNCQYQQLKGQCLTDDLLEYLLENRLEEQHLGNFKQVLCTFSFCVDDFWLL